MDILLRSSYSLRLDSYMLQSKNKVFVFPPYMNLAVYVRGFFYSCVNPDNTNITAITGLTNCVSISKHPITIVTCPKCLSFMVSPLSNLTAQL